MLNIRSAQMRVLEAATLQSFVRKVADDVRVRLAGCCTAISDDELCSLLERGIDRASNFEIGERADLVLFLDLVVAHGLDFPAAPAFDWAAPLLGDAALSGDVKVAFLYERMPDELLPSVVASQAVGSR